MKMKKLMIASFLALPIALSLASVGFAQREVTCKAYTVTIPTERRAPLYDEVNNCPLVKGKFSIQGTFANKTRAVYLHAWEAAFYLYKGKNYINGSSVDLSGFDVAGTTRRPQYRFTDKKLTYVISFQYSDADTIRLEVFRGKQRIINDLLQRKSKSTRPDF
ncbi:hypothetical protein IQ266_20150 [filamentous cyanobacterium LEGE 11480]|uniref:Secreted protein n=1 Tax=Romeriopsis navalis LEGE 11480 TaxID=2777977 RepID=A0A928VTP7_9CYAN|nr:hypothetical protein [Romeriopsis navalis]MBE9032054.1 hypothetical protein [Romeriopsis navalis LEGE 11480]